MKQTPVVLTIAGSDSSGGAGLQADLKTFEAHGVFGASAVTLITAQNTRGVQAFHVLEPSLVVAQIRAVLDDLPVAVIKLGALGRADVIAAVAELLAEYAHIPVVVDPVMVSKHAHLLLDNVAIGVLAQRIVPLATVLTPNQHEATVLLGEAVNSIQSARHAAKALLERGANAVVVKGGGGAGDHVVDVVATSRGVRELIANRVAGNNVHGSGCTFAAAIAAQLALGATIDDAIDAARVYTVAAIANAPGLGGGVGPLGHKAAAWTLR